jgi:hypothetical protein
VTLALVNSVLNLLLTAFKIADSQPANGASLTLGVQLFYTSIAAPDLNEPSG